MEKEENLDRARTGGHENLLLGLMMKLEMKQGNPEEKEMPMNCGCCF